MKSKVASFFRVLAALAIGASLVPALVSPAPAIAGNQAWTTLSDPARIGTGAVKSIAFAADGLTGFAAVSTSTSTTTTGTYLQKTTNGGVTWSSVGNFDEDNANKPTDLTADMDDADTRIIVRVSPHYATDATVIVAVADYDGNDDAALTDHVNQILWSKDGGATFTKIRVGTGTDIDANTLIMDMVLSENFDGSNFVKDRVLVLTADDADNTRGALWRLRGSATSPSWTAWGSGPVTGDYYAAKYFPGSDEEVLAIASADNHVGNDDIDEYRLNIGETSSAATLAAYATGAAAATTPSRTGLGVIVVDRAETVWTDATGNTLSTLDTDAGDFVEGVGSSSQVAAGALAAGDVMGTIDLGVAGTLDLSGATTVTISIRSSVATAAGDLNLILDSGAAPAVAGAEELISIPAMATANTWTRFTLNLATPAGDAAIRSIGLEYNVDIGAATIHIDHIIAGGQFQGAADELLTTAGVALPENWSQGASSDREVIATRTAADVGRLLRRSGNTAIAALGTAQGAPTDGYTSVAVSGNATTGFALAGTDGGGVLRTTNGGGSWSTVASDITDEIDGNAGNTAVAVASSKGWIGNGGLRGGAWRTENKGSSWKSSGIYSDQLDLEYRDIARTSDGTWFLVGQDTGTGVESVFKATSTLAFYQVNRHDDVQLVRPSPNFATDQAVYLGQTTGTTGQVLKSTDGGETFATTTTDPDQVGTTDMGLVLSELLVLDKDTVIAALAGGKTALSTDGGATWTHSTSNPSNTIVSIRVHSDGTTLLANGATSGRTVYVSTNKGITWSQKGAAIGAGNGRDVAFDPNYATNSYIYIATSGTTSAVWRLKASTATTTTAWDAIGNDINPAGVGVNSMIVAAQNDGYRLGFDATGALWVASFDDGNDDDAYDANEASFVGSTFDPKEAAVTWRTVPTAITNGSFGIGSDTFQRQMLIYGTPAYIVTISDEANNDMNTLTDTSAAPVALTPADKTTGVPRATALQWSAVPDATTYDARLGLTLDPFGNGGLAYNATDQTGVESTDQYGGDGMNVGSTFYWKVREQAPLTSRWSSVWSFKVGEAGVAGVDPNPTPAGGLAAFAGSYETAWRFDNATQSWKMYDPAAPAAVSTMTNLVINTPFVLVAKAAGAFTYGSRTYTVVKGVNLLSWLGN